MLHKEMPLANLELLHIFTPLFFQYFIKYMLFHSRSYGNIYHRSRRYKGNNDEWLGHDQSLYEVFYDMHNATMNLCPLVVLTVDNVSHVIYYYNISNYSA